MRIISFAASIGHVGIPQASTADPGYPAGTYIVGRPLTLTQAGNLQDLDGPRILAVDDDGYAIELSGPHATYDEAVASFRGLVGSDLPLIPARSGAR